MKTRHRSWPLCPWRDGERLYAGDASLEETQCWYADEKDAYAKLLEQQRNSGYEYCALNRFHAFRQFGRRCFRLVIAFGFAAGDDVEPLAPTTDRFLAVEPAECFRRRSIGGKPAEFIRPTVSGRIECSREIADLVVCVGVLHHSPHVSFVISEFHRVLANNGLLILREPVCSVGDWRKPRPGPANWERGIPAKFLIRRLTENGFRVLRRRFCGFRPVPRLARVMGIDAAYKSPFLVRLDDYFSVLSSWNYRYHPVALLEKSAPTMLFIVAQKLKRRGTRAQQ